MADNAISDHPDWFADDTTDVHREAAIDTDFSNLVADDPAYQQGDAATQAQYKEAHRQLVEESALNSQHNPSNIRAEYNQRNADYSGAAENALTKGIESHSDLLTSAAVLDDAWTSRDDSTAKDFSKVLQKRREHVVTREQKVLAADINKFMKKVDKDGFINDAAAYGELAWDIVTNPGAVLQTAAESSSSMSVIAGGAKAGAVAGPYGAVAGMFAASTADSAKHKLISELQNALDDQGYAYTPTNIKMFLDKNPKLYKEMQTKSKKYGATLGAVDALTGGILGKIATLPTRAARKAAMQSMGAAERAAIGKATARYANLSGKSAKEVTEEVTEGLITQGTKDNLAAMSFKKKVGYKATAVAGETASEPLSEAVATAAVGDEVKADDLIYETIGGIGSGPIAAGISVSATGTKAGSTKTAKFAKSVMNNTAGTREVLKEQAAATKAAKKLNRADSDVKFKKDKEEVTPDDARVEDWANVEHADYNPIKAATILAKSDDPAAIDRVRAVQKDVLKNLAEIDARRQKLSAGIEEGETVPRDLARAQKSAQEEYDLTLDTAKKVTSRITEMRNKAEAAANATAAEVKPIDTAVATPAEVTDNIVASLGSSDTTNRVTEQQLDEVLARDDLKDTERTVFTKFKEAAAIEQEVLAAQQVLQKTKNIMDVGNDVYNGSEEFKGINAYRQAIQSYLHPARNNVKGAEGQLEGLKRFRDLHNEKSDVFNTLFRGETLSTEQEVVWERLQRDSTSEELYIDQRSKKLVAAVTAEAAALNKEVELVEGLIALKAEGDQTTTTDTAAEANTTADVVTDPTETTETGTVAEVMPNEQLNLFDAAPEVNTAATEAPTQPTTDNDTKTKEEVVDNPDDNVTEVPYDEEQAPVTKEQTVAAPEAANPTVEPIIDAELMDVSYTEPDGTQVTKPADEALADIETQIEECNSILKCLAKIG